MWPSQYWGALQGSPRSPCLKQNQKCWELAFPLQTHQQQNAPTVLRIASPPLSHHGYGSHASPVLFSVSCLSHFSHHVGAFHSSFVLLIFLWWPLLSPFISQSLYIKDFFNLSMSCLCYASLIYTFFSQIFFTFGLIYTSSMCFNFLFCPFPTGWEQQRLQPESWHLTKDAL